MDINFNFQKNITLTNRKKLKQFIIKIFKIEKVALESMSYVFCSDEFLLQINKDYLKHDYYTDIISFDLSLSKSSPVIGEVYISVDTIRDNTKRFETTIQLELHRVIFHGALHMCGYKDKTKKDQALMTTKEDEYLSLYFKNL
jgi:probable rRNA maturation factor